MVELKPEGIASILRLAFPGCKPERSKIIGGHMVIARIGAYDLTIYIRSNNTATISLGHSDPTRSRAPRRVISKATATDEYETLNEFVTKARSHLLNVSMAIMAACSQRPADDGD